MCSYISIRPKNKVRESSQKISSLLVLIPSLDLSQKEWLTGSVRLMDGLSTIIQVLDNALGRVSNPGSVSPGENYERRQTYLLMSSCKLFCMTAEARIYLETSKLPIVPKGEKDKFRGLARESVHTYLGIYKTFDQEDDLRHLDYFTTVSRSSTLPSCLRFRR